MPAKPYNGHESWNAWNVALWIGNEESLYLTAMGCLRDSERTERKGKRSADRAARSFLTRTGVTRTPDGAKYSLRSVRLALIGLEA